MAERPYMNGAEERLTQLQRRIEQLRAGLDKIDAQNAQHLIAVKREATLARQLVEATLEELRGSQTLAGNWRVLAFNDLSFMIEFLRNANVAMLAEAVRQEGGGRLIEALRQAAGE